MDYILKQKPLIASDNAIILDACDKWFNLVRTVIEENIGEYPYIDICPEFRAGGEGIISELADELTQKYGKGFDKRSLYRYVQFYQSYPEIVGIMTPQSGEHAMIVKGRRILTWSHYERLLQVLDTTARAWYEKEAIEQSWSVKTLRRNIST